MRATGSAVRAVHCKGAFPRSVPWPCIVLHIPTLLATPCTYRPARNRDLAFPKEKKTIGCGRVAPGPVVRGSHLVRDRRRPALCCQPCTDFACPPSPLVGRARTSATDPTFDQIAIRKVSLAAERNKRRECFLDPTLSKRAGRNAGAARADLVCTTLTPTRTQEAFPSQARWTTATPPRGRRTRTTRRRSPPAPVSCRSNTDRPMVIHKTTSTTTAGPRCTRAACRLPPPPRSPTRVVAPSPAFCAGEKPRPRLLKASAADVTCDSCVAYPRRRQKYGHPLARAAEGWSLTRVMLLQNEVLRWFSLPTVQDLWSSLW